MGTPPTGEPAGAVALGERVAVGAYGATHRASLGGARPCLALVLDRRLADDPTVRAALRAEEVVEAARRVAHPGLIPTLAVVARGDELVVVTPPVAPHVSAQDLLARGAGPGATAPLERPLAAAVGRGLLEALAAAHEAGVVHGAPHPRSVLADEQGAVRVADLALGRALAAAVAGGGAPGVARLLEGFVAPELEAGHPATRASDVHAAGAVLLALLGGATPGALRDSPSVERAVRRALAPSPARRYHGAGELLEALVEALEDDRWAIAPAAALAAVAGRAQPEARLDDATEDLLASLGDVGRSPVRASIDLRAAAAAARVARRGSRETSGRLEALLADLDEPVAPAQIDDAATRGAPEVERAGPHPAEPAEAAEAAALAALGELDAAGAAADEAAALAVLRGLDGPAASSGGGRPAPGLLAPPRPAPRGPVEPPAALAAPPPAPRRRLGSALWVLLILGVSAGAIHLYQRQAEAQREYDRRRAAAQAAADDATRRAHEALPDPGALRVASRPSGAAVWLKLGRTPCDSLPLSAATAHALRLELPGFAPRDAVVGARAWAGQGDARRASVAVALAPEARAGRAAPSPFPPPAPAPAPAPAVPAGAAPGDGPIHVESTPAGAEVWLYVGRTDQVELRGIRAGAPYELRVLAAGYLPGYVSIAADDWRDGGDPREPIDAARKKAVLQRTLDLVPLPPGARPSGPR